MIRDDIVGVWELHGYEVRSGNGEVEYPLGRDAEGIIIFTADGFMSAQLMRPNRLPYDRPSMTGGTAEQIVEAARGYLAYAGRFEWNQDDSTSRHHVAVSLLPNWLGHTQIRHASLESGTLTLSATTHRDGREQTATLTWKRPAEL